MGEKHAGYCVGKVAFRVLNPYMVKMELLCVDNTVCGVKIPDKVRPSEGQVEVSQISNRLNLFCHGAGL